MHYAVSGRAPSILSAGLALLLAVGMHLSAATRTKPARALADAQPAVHMRASADRTLHEASVVGTRRRAS
jgi:hypothetical protein